MKRRRFAGGLVVAALFAASAAAHTVGDLSTSAAGTAAREAAYRILLWSDRYGTWRV
jgi:hypothetical protein